MKQFFKASLLAILLINLVGCSEKMLTDAEKVTLKANIKEDIAHHLQDSYDFHLFTMKGDSGEADTHIGFPLPVILIDGGVQFFMSSKFHHGLAIAQSGGNYYKLSHGKIYKTEANGELTPDGHGHFKNEMPINLSLTKTVTSTFFVVLLIFFLFKKVGKSYKTSLVPKGFGKILEPLVIFVRDEIAIPNIGEKKHAKYMPYLLTVFFFIWFINLTGLTPLGINVTGNIAITTSLAILTFIITTASGNKNYWKHIFWMPGVPVPMKIILAPIELLGVLIKPFALLIRLYANISAGHIVLMSLIGLLFVFQNAFARGAFFGLTIFLSLIELLVAFLQAYIFTMLSALYFGMAVEEHDHEEGH
ncbi:MAG: F-type H+-transporting ATPase subunit a [Saprospiraceae bacterium]|jgi:F-type H+-transporting ATPase subunit a